MEAKLYKLVVYESSLEWTHGFGHSIWEIWIKEVYTVFNEAGGMFRSPQPRASDGIDIDVPYQTAIDVDQMIIRTEKINKLRKETFDPIKEKYGEAQRDIAKEKLDAWVAGGRKGELNLAEHVGKEIDLSSPDEPI